MRTALFHRLPSWLNQATAWMVQRSGGRLGLHLLLLVVGLMLLVLGCSHLLTQASVEQHRQDTLNQQLQRGELLLQKLLAERAARLMEGAVALAVVPTISRSEPGPGPTAFEPSQLALQRERLGASLALIWRPVNNFNLSADSAEQTALGAVAPSEPAALTDARRELVAAAQRLTATGGAPVPLHGLAYVQNRVQHVVVVPVAPMLATATAVAGQGAPRYLVMAFALDAGLSQEFKRLAALSLSVWVRGTDQQPWQLAAGSATAELTQGMAAQADLLTPSPTQTKPLLRTQWLSRQPPADASGFTAAALAPAVAQADILAVLSVPPSMMDAGRADIDHNAYLITAVAVVLLAWACAGFASRLTSRLRVLQGAAERVARGELNSVLRDPLSRAESWDAPGDEVHQVASSFERMRLAVRDRQAQVLKLAYWDSLTGLPNQVQFTDATQAAIESAPRLQQGVAVLVLSLRGFRQVNQLLGHHLGDRLLTRVAERLSQHALREGDLVARLGGTHFAVLLRQGDAALARSVADRLIQAFVLPWCLSDESMAGGASASADLDVKLGVEIGMACWPAHAHSADQLLKCAELARQSVLWPFADASLTGKACMLGDVAAQPGSTSAVDTTAAPMSAPQMYLPEMDNRSHEAQNLLHDLRRAVDMRQLLLVLQPRLALDTGAVVGAEALLRWQHPKKGLLLPQSFIPLAQATGLMRHITLWMFEEAAQLWQTLHSEGISLSLSVNLGQGDLLDRQLPALLDAVLVKHRAPAEAFCLEVAERGLMDQPARQMSSNLERLSALGFKLALDDYGAGYSSLLQLKDLPLDELKIDAALVQTMHADMDNAKIVRATIDLAHQLGLTVVAEGVENAKTWDLLRELNCDCAQGQHMGSPMPLAEFKAWCGAWVVRQKPAGVVSSLMLH